VSAPALIVYDGECIFCQNYVSFLRLQEAVGPVELVDARSGDPRVAALVDKGIDLDEGMVFVNGKQVHHGADAVHVLATLTSSATALNRLNARIFASPALTRTLYPAMKLGRRITLMLRGRTLLRDRPGAGS